MYRLGSDLHWTFSNFFSQSFAMAPVFVAGKTSIQAFDFDTKSLERQMKRHSGAGKLLHMKSIWSIYDPYMIHMVLSKTRLNMVNYHQFAPVPLVHHLSPLKRPFGRWRSLAQAASASNNCPSCFGCRQNELLWWLLRLVVRQACGFHVQVASIPGYNFHVLPPHQQCETREIRPRRATKMSFCSHLVAPNWRFWSQVPRKAKRSLLMSRSWFCPQAKRLAGLKGILNCIVLTWGASHLLSGFKQITDNHW